MNGTYPANIEAERALLGACLVSETAVTTAGEILGPEDFITPRHQHIFAAIIDTYANGRVELLTVHERVKHLDITVDDLFALHNGPFSVSAAGKYARLVADARLRYRLVEASGEIAKLGWGETASADAGDAAERARALLAGLDIPTGVGAPDPDVATFLASVDTEYDWLVPGFLEHRDRLMLTATEGAGKSVLLTQIAVQIAAGIHPWTLQKITPRNVTLIDLENPARLVTRRLDTLTTVAGARLDPQRLRIHSRPSGIDLTTRPDKLWLLDRCRANAAELVVIGPAYRMAAGVASRGDVGGEDQTRTVTAALDEVRSRCNVTLIIETHAPHGQSGHTRDLRPFGSSVWLRWPEFGIGLRKDPAGTPGLYDVEHWRGARDERVWPKQLQRGGVWPWTPVMPTGTFGVAA